MIDRTEVHGRVAIAIFLLRLFIEVYSSMDASQKSAIFTYLDQECSFLDDDDIIDVKAILERTF